MVYEKLDFSINLKKISKNGILGEVIFTAIIESNHNNTLDNFILYQNYPNPFNPTTTIKYQIPEKSRVKIEIFNILGQHINTLVDEIKDASSYEIVWNGKNKYGNLVSSGVYIYRVTAQAGGEKFVFHKKMMLLK